MADAGADQYTFHLEATGNVINKMLTCSRLKMFDLCMFVFVCRFAYYFIFLMCNYLSEKLTIFLWFDHGTLQCS